MSLPILGMVALGGAIGAGMRHLVTSRVASTWGGVFPYGTLTVNVVGSLLMGVVIGLCARYLPVDQHIRAFLSVGVLGGFTTFSAFSLDTMTLIERGEMPLALFYILTSVVLSVGALFFGLVLVRAIV